MGFLRADIEVAMQAMQSNETDVVMEYLLNNPRGEEFQSSLLAEGESVTATGGAVDAAGDVDGPLQDITAIGAEGEGLIAGADLSAAPATGTGTVPVTASLAASIGDISVIESDDSMAVQDPATSLSEMPVDLNAVDSVRSIAGATTGTATTTAAGATATAAAVGMVAIEAASAAPEQTQTTATTTTASTTAAAASGPADVLLLRRDLGQLITELSRLCEEDGTPRLLDPTAAIAPEADSVPTLDSASLPPSITSTAEAIPVPQGIEAPSIAVPGTPIPVIPSVSTDEGPHIRRARETVSEAQLMLQTLGRQGLGLPPADPGSANWVSPASRAVDAMVRPIKYSETQNHTHFYHLFMQFAVRVCMSLHGNL